jgi:DNA ligase-1
LQIHRFGDRIWLYSRRGIEKSKVLPEVIDIARQIRSNCFIIDSEVVAIDKNGNLLPFVKLLNRTVRKELDKSILEEVNVTVKCFDILYYEGYNLMRQPLRTRLDILSRIVPSEYMADGINCECESELMAYYRRTLRKGLEGIMVKDLNSSYEVGVRSWSWLKLKPERDTLDVVIVKARYGRSGRAGIYSSFQIAVRDRIERKLYTIGRVANLSEQLFLQLRDRIEKLKIARDRDGIWIKPSIVLEVTYFEIQKSPDETSGFALRFPKIVSIRDDKRVEEIDTIDKVKQLFKMQYERFPEKELA